MNQDKITDLYGKEITELSNKKLFLFDMDGTIYEENRVFEGTLEMLDFINDIGGKYVFITNNSSKSVEDYVEKVNRLGIKCTSNNFFTSAQATILYLEEHFPNKKIYCQGTKSFVKEISNSGICVTECVEDDVDVVLVGFDMELTSEKLRKTCELLVRNIPFIATNPDLRCPVSFGFIPDCGSICAMIQAATDKNPMYIGKPEPTMVNIVREKLGYTSDQTVVIGDRLYTDIASGLNAGVTAVCVLSGEATANDIKIGNIKPSYTFTSINEMYLAISDLTNKMK